MSCYLVTMKASTNVKINDIEMIYVSKFLVVLIGR